MNVILQKMAWELLVECGGINMSRIFKTSYTAFQRHILSEFITDEELKELDRKYNKAKIKRLERFYRHIIKNGQERKY